MTQPTIVRNKRLSSEEAEIVKKYEQESAKGTSYGDEIRAQKRRDEALAKLNAK